ncbi:MAG: S8 family serine peptidase, partial [Oscillospiraceae bacterium]|nr:S8 family serine peptidase [Oscillospiraceae bacterium]
MKHIRTLLSLLLVLSMVLSCFAGVSAAEINDSVLVEETKPSAMHLGALSEEFKAVNTHEYADTDIVRAIIVLESAPEADVEGTEAEKSAYRLRLNKEHAAVKKAMTMAYEPAHEFTAVLNGFSCDVAYGELENIAKIDGVASVHIANHYEAPRLEKPQNNYANQMIGNATMNQSGYKGQGIVVAVLDTGLHTTHEAFKVYSNMPLTSTLTSSSLSKVSVNAKYLSQKVPFAYDYADKDNNVADSQGHGTHVAGTAVGYAASSDGGVIMSGGAPAAQLVAMKIFSDNSGGTSSDIYFSALDDAYKLGVDVVNMSIGAQNGFTYDSSLEGTFGNIYKRMEQAGIVMCVAAGNEYSMAQFSSVGFIGTDYTDYGTIANPASYEGNVSIAAVQNSHYPDYALEFNGKSFLFIDSCQDNTHGWLQTFGGKSTSVVVLKNGSDLAIGQESDYASVNVRNKIVVVSRGEISFQEKMDFAANAGAAGIIVVNDEEGRISMSIDPFAIPAISVEMAYRDAFLTASSSATLYTPNAKTYVENPEAYQMCAFSNWGPTPMLTIDPTISSIGGNVYSAVPTGNSAYEVMSGTSMACPSAAGTFACLLEALRETGVAGNTSGGSRKTMTKAQSLEKAVALMASTGIILADANDYLYSVRKQGGGLANSANSASVFNDGAYITNPIQELGDDKEKTGVYTMDIELVNEGYSDVVYDNLSTYVLYDYPANAGNGFIVNTLTSD